MARATFEAKANVAQTVTDRELMLNFVIHWSGLVCDRRAVRRRYFGSKVGSKVVYDI